MYHCQKVLLIYSNLTFSHFSPDMKKPILFFHREGSIALVEEGDHRRACGGGLPDRAPGGRPPERRGGFAGGEEKEENFGEENGFHLPLETAGVPRRRSERSVAQTESEEEYTILLLDIVTTSVPGFHRASLLFQSTRLARETFVSCSGT